MKKRGIQILLIAVWGFVVFGSSGISFAGVKVKDGFVSAETIESRYFTIHLEDGVDKEDLAMRISPPESLRSIVRSPIVSEGFYALSDEIDILFLSIEEIMDLRPRDFKSKMKICKDSSGLSNVAFNLFGRHMQQGGFYVLQLDTLYVSAEDISIYIMGHEMSHAIQSHYFVVPTPVKIQEVLAGYVEFQLRKYK